MCNQKFISKFIKKGSYVFNFAEMQVLKALIISFNAQKLNIMGNLILEVCKKKILRDIYMQAAYMFLVNMEVFKSYKAKL